MRALCDTHTLAWWLQNSSQLGPNAKAVLENPHYEILVSAVSVFEMATKFRSGKWPNIGALVNDFETAVNDEGFKFLGVNATHALMAGSFASDHRDPFDRLLAAQAIIEDCEILTADQQIKDLGARVVW
jgi:PIN domain nuclease of toxin-antitoxin system